MWKEFSISSEIIIEKNQQIKKGSEQLRHASEHLIKDAVERGYLVK